MRKGLKWAGLVVVLLVLGIQLYQPDRSNPTVDESKTISAAMQVPAEVNSIFERACNDCHSNKTKWPWYSYVAPASWIISDDVKEGRQRLNFSTWADYRKNRQASKLEEIRDLVIDQEMPMKKYVLLHPSASLTQADIDLVARWADEAHQRLSEPDSTANEK
jgi:hypothetical protein